MAKYRTIVADPPWEIERRRIGGGIWATGKRERAELPYDTLPVSRIAAMPIGDLAEPTAHLYLWVIQRHLRAGFEVAEAWGFEPISTLVWAKPPGGFIGGTFYSNVEFVLFCRRGPTDMRSKANSSWWSWPRGSHSTKPDAFFDLVESVSHGAYLELFARRKRLGWDAWGNEIDSDVEIAA